MAAELVSPARIAPPSSQTMSAFSPPPQPPPTPPADSDGESSSHDGSNRFSQSSNSNKLTVSPTLSLRSEEYRQLFRLPPEEVLVQDFNCALQENILLQGHMYLFEHYICFYSNIFGFESKKIIPFQDVTAVKRAKTAGIFPNAIEIVASTKRHFFASFLSRDEAFRLIVDGWSQNGNGPTELLDNQDSKSEISSQLNGGTNSENGNTSDSPVNDRDSDDRNLEVPSFEDTNSSSNPVDDDVRPTCEEVLDTVEERQGVDVTARPSTSRSVNWKEEMRDAPEIPKGYTKAGESKFPVNVEQFFDYFFSDGAGGFVESYHQVCGDKDFKCTSWKPHEKFGYIRETSFQHPIKVYFGAKCGGCKETQKYIVFKNCHLVIETSQEVSDVPYADYFTVEGIWDVQKDDNEEGCILRVYVTVAFSKRTIFKGKIEQSTMEECRDTYATWIDLAHKLLKQKNIEKTEGNNTSNTNLLAHSASHHFSEFSTITFGLKIMSSRVDTTANNAEGNQIDQKNSGENGDHAEVSHANVESGMVTSNVTNGLGIHGQTGNLLQRSLLHATTITSTMKAFADKFFSSLTSRGNLKQFLVITFFVILLLMQLSIVVLLSRPQQVYVIPQADHFSSIGLGSTQRAAEAMAWMEKRVHLLKDEMLVVEGQLERMRHEHVMLKAQIKDMEQLMKQQDR